MEFIKRMKKREFIEMTLKALAALFACFVAIILMEGMIYGIELNSLKKNATEITATDSSSTIAYCIKEGDDNYLVLYHTEGMKNDKGESAEWIAVEGMSESQCEFLKTSNSVKEVVMHAPNAFTFSITPVHYVIISILIAGVVGFFVWRYVLLAKQYKKIEKQYQNNGYIEIN